jgi:hypothetical protein
LPNTDAACERTSAAASATSASTRPGRSRSRIFAASAGAVTAGCLVATVKCASAIIRKTPA